MFENVNGEYFRNSETETIVRMHTGLSANPINDKSTINSYNISWAKGGDMVSQAEFSESEILNEIITACNARLGEIQ